MRLKIQFVFLLTALLPVFSGAAFADTSLARSVRAAHIIVIGEITRIARAEEESVYKHDIAFINARDILRGKKTLRNTIGNTRAVPLSFPSIHNRLHVSTDVRYKTGDLGIWLLQVHDGRIVGCRPLSLLPLAQRSRVERILKEKIYPKRLPENRTLRVVPPLPIRLVR